MKKFLGPKSIFCYFKNGQKYYFFLTRKKIKTEYFPWKLKFCLIFMENINFFLWNWFIDFTSFLVWTWNFFRVLAHCAKWRILLKADLVISGNLVFSEVIIFVLREGMPAFVAALSEFRIRCEAFSIWLVFSPSAIGFVISVNFKESVLEDFLTRPAGISVSLSFLLRSPLKIWIRIIKNFYTI